MADIFDEIKKRIKLEDLIREDFPLRGHGHEFRGDREDCNSLVITQDRKTGEQYYYWNSKGQGGDAVNYMMNEHGMDRKSAVEYLCKKGGLTLPEWGHQDTKSWLATKAREDVLSVAARVFQGFLKATPAAVDYCHGRGWTDETIEKSRVGFSGSATAAEIKAMRGEFAANGIDPESPAGVAILGFRGDVAGWAQKHGMIQAISTEDISNGYITGMMNRPRLIYPHVMFEKVSYLSARNLKWTDEIKLVNEPDKKYKSFNPRKELMGERQPYFGWNYRSDAKKIILVEGQADVITLCQWGLAPVGLVGVHLGEFWGKTLVDRHETIYFATDGDKAGQTAIKGKNGDWPIADELSPLVQVVRWPLKDANDLRQEYVRRGLDDAEQLRRVNYRLEAAAPVVLKAARAAAATRGNADKQRAMERTFEIIAKIPPKVLGLMTTELVKATGLKFAEFNRAVKAARGEAEKEDDGKGLEREPTAGGWFPVNDEGTEGYLVDLLFDQKKQKAKLAYAHIDLTHPEKREIAEANYLDINGKRLEPMVDDNIRYGTVMLPSELGPEKPMNELLAMLEFFIRRYFLLDNPLQYKTASLYALFTWLNDAFDALPYLRARGGPGSGKSELMLLIGRVCYRMMITSSLTSLAGFKGMAHLYKGTLMIDEADSIPREHQDELRALLNGRAMKEQARIITMMETVKADGSHSYTPTTTYVYGPTLLTMYKAFKDPATETRCITFDLFQKDVIELEEAGIEPGVVQESMRTEAVTMRNYLIRWRLKTWLPKLEVPAGVKIINRKTSPRMNQIMRPLKILAYLLKDKQMEADIDMIAEANYEDELNRRAGSFEAMLLRTVIAVDEDKKYAEYVKTGEMRHYGVVRYVLYKDLAYVANEIIDSENMNENATDKKKDSVKAQTIGSTCRDAFRLPVERTGKGWVVILDKHKLEIGKLRFGLRDMDIQGETKPVVTQEAML
jgi:DNA primase